MKRAALSALAVLVVAAVAPAAGAVERQHHLGVGGGPAILKVDDKTTLSIGGVGNVHYAYGLSDAFNFMAEGGYALVALDEASGKDASGKDIPATRPAGIGHAGAGVAYVLDVVQWVPYVGLMPTAYMLNGGSLDGTKMAFGASLALGLDYQISRSIAAGVALRQHMLLTNVSTYPTYTQALLRVELMWGW